MTKARLVRVVAGNARRNRTRRPQAKIDRPTRKHHGGVKSERYERSSGMRSRNIQQHVRHPVHNGWPPLEDGYAKPEPGLKQSSCCPVILRGGGRRKKHRRSYSHHMWVANAKSAVCRFITGAKLDRAHLHADPLYQHLPVTAAERQLWRCVEDGEMPRWFGVEPHRPRNRSSPLLWI